MKEFVSYCDHCKRKLDERIDYVDIELKLQHAFNNTTDLCKPCWGELKTVIRDFIGWNDGGEEE